MSSWGTVDCELRVPLAVPGEMPVDRTILGAWIGKIGAQGTKGSARKQIEAISGAISGAEGAEAVIHVRLSAEDADIVRLAVIRLADQARNPDYRRLDAGEMADHRAAAYGLDIFHRAWVAWTGWQGRKQCADITGLAVAGSGYAR